MNSFRNHFQTRMWLIALALSVFVAGCGGGGDEPPGISCGSGRLLGADGAGGNLANLYVLNSATGAVASTIGPIGFAVTGMAVHPTTKVLYGVTGGADPVSPAFLITIDKATGAGAAVGDLDPAGTSPVADITFTSDGTLYGWFEGSDDLVTIDLTTGAATVVADSTIGTSGSGIAASPGDVLFFTGSSDTGPLRTVDRVTGLTTDVATLNGTSGFPINALAFSGSTLCGSRLNSPTSELITINTTTAAITVVGPSVDLLDAIVFDN
ncbi:MAG TPA: hypothetical protein VGQ19_00780 [Burkholderiales bacterium]|jgi:hypothetical protein|nr:hypothetical protein [Burkholderiales bacterium]